MELQVPQAILMGKGCASAGTGMSGAGALLAPTNLCRGRRNATGTLGHLQARHCQDSPLPGAEVDNQKSIIFIGVNVMEKVEGRGAVFDVEEPAFLFLCHMKPDLKSKQLLGVGSEK